ncbi:hypothetical protein GW932_04080, partial [archaeon]|nr:hypothetical protein [archaeon]
MEKRGSILLVLLFSLVFVSSLGFNFLSPSSEINTNNTEVTLNFFNVTNLFDLVFSWDKANYSIYDGSLILMMDFNNNSNLGENDSVVVDLSRYGHNGSVLGGASYVSSGKYGGAYNFSEGEGINISASEDFNVDEFTISMWIK